MAKAGLSDLHLKEPLGDFQLCFRVLQPPRLILRNDLERGSTASFSVNMERWDQRQGLPLRVLVLEVPALKIGARPIRTVEKSHNLSPRIQFSPNLGILYGIFSDAGGRRSCLGEKVLRI